MRLFQALAFVVSAFILSVSPCQAVKAAPPWSIPPTVGSGLGVHIKGDYADDAALTEIGQSGFSFVRFSIGWGGVEREKGVFDWHDSDALIARVRDHGLKMIIPMLGGNGLYDGWIEAPQPNTDRVKTRPRAPRTPEAVQAYARFVTQAVLRYGTKDIVWEIWNEPDLARFWPPQPDVQALTTLAQITCQMVRAVAPQVVLVGPALARVPDRRDNVTASFFDAFLASGAPQCLDAISVHPYRHGREEPEAAFGDYATLFGLMAQRHVYLPLINTEWGYTTTQVSPEEQAAYALRARLTDMMWGVPVSVWYEWQDSRDDPIDPEGHFGLVAYHGGAKPALIAVQKLWPQVRASVLEQQVPTSDPHDVLLLLRNPQGTRILVGWTLRQALPVHVTFLRDGEQGQAGLGPVPSLMVQGQSIDVLSVTEGRPTP